MFAPNPPRLNSEIEVHVITNDGNDHVWQPFDDPSMRKMQWRKFKEDIINGAEYRPGLALWAIRQEMRKVDDTTIRPVRVAIVATFETVPLPGQGEPKSVKKIIFDRRVPANTGGVGR